MDVFITRMQLLCLTKLAVTSWYHQISSPYKYSPIVSSLSLNHWCVWFRVYTCIWFSCFLCLLYFRADPLPLCEETDSAAVHSVECHPFWIYIFASLWSHLICSCILCISCRVETSSRNYVIRVQILGWEFIRHTGHPLLCEFGRHIVGHLSY